MRDFVALSDKKDFARIYASAKKWHANGCVVYFEPSESKKISVVASKKIGKAVARNRAKRLLRASFSLCCENLASGNYIIVSKQGLLELAFSEISRSLRWSLRRLGALKNHQN